MNQSLYAHMNNKRKMKEKKRKTSYVHRLAELLFENAYITKSNLQIQCNSRQ
jgi:hypothetical protein